MRPCANESPLHFVEVVGRDHQADGEQVTEPPRVYRGAKLSENCTLWNRHKRRMSIGARLFFLPAYSPALNPPYGDCRQSPTGQRIEQVFAKLKHLLRKAAERRKEAVWLRIGSLLDQFSPKKCENYLRNSAYGSV